MGNECGARAATWMCSTDDLPCDEEDLALLAPLLGDEVEVVDAVPALVAGRVAAKSS